jgi:hypothetical protein
VTFRQQAGRPSTLATGAIKSEPPSKRVKREAGEDDTDLAANGGVFKGKHPHPYFQQGLIKQSHSCQSSERLLDKSRTRRRVAGLDYQKKRYVVWRQENENVTCQLGLRATTSFQAKTATLNPLDLATSNLVSTETPTTIAIVTGITGEMTGIVTAKAGTMHLRRNLSSGNRNGMEVVCAFQIEDGMRRLVVLGMPVDMARMTAPRAGDGIKLLVRSG